MRFSVYRFFLYVLVGMTMVRFGGSIHSPPPTLSQSYVYTAPEQQEIGTLPSPDQYGDSNGQVTIANEVPFFNDVSVTPRSGQMRGVVLDILPNTKRVILQMMTQSTKIPIAVVSGTAISGGYHSYLLPNFGEGVKSAASDHARTLAATLLPASPAYRIAKFGCFDRYAVEFARISSTEGASRVYYIEETVQPDSKLQISYYPEERDIAGSTAGSTAFFRLYQLTDEEYEYWNLIPYDGAFAESISEVLLKEGSLIAKQDRRILQVPHEQELYHEYAGAVRQWGKHLLQDRVKSDDWQIHLEQLGVGVKALIKRPNRLSHVLFNLAPHNPGGFVASVVVPLSRNAEFLQLIIGVCRPVPNDATTRAATEPDDRLALGRFSGITIDATTRGATEPNDRLAVSRLIGIATDARARAAMSEDIKEGSFYQKVRDSMETVLPTNFEALQEVPVEILEKTAPDGVFMYRALRRDSIFTFELQPQDLVPTYDLRGRLIGQAFELSWWNYPPGRDIDFDVYVFSREDLKPTLRIEGVNPMGAGTSDGPKAFTILSQAAAKSINVPEPGYGPILDASKFRLEFPQYPTETEHQRFMNAFRRQSGAGSSSGSGGQEQGQEGGQEQASTPGGEQPSRRGAGRRLRNFFSRGSSGA